MFVKRTCFSRRFFIAKRTSLLCHIAFCNDVLQNKDQSWNAKHKINLMWPKKVVY